MDKISPVALVAALLGTGGAGLFVREIVDVFLKLALGVSARESKRKLDLVRRADEADARADREERNRARVAEYAVECRMKLLETGQYTRDTLPRWPDLEPDPPLTAAVAAPTK